jgi:hypothetical protein
MGRRGRILIGIGVVVLISVLAAVVVAPRVGNSLAGADGIHDAAVLPRQIQLCGRSWRGDALDRRFTAVAARDAFGGVVVDPGPLGSCPPGPCTDVAQPGACDVVIWVRVGEDAYLDYALQGGP